MTSRLLWFSFILFYFNGLNGQDVVQFGTGVLQNTHPHEQCAHTAIHEKLMEEDESYRDEQLAREESLSQLIEETRSGLVPKSDEIFTIPVVVHIIHDGDAYGTGSNITDEQVWSAINGLNEDFRKMAGTNGDGEGADIGVEFCLAQRDPDGNPHSGINRVSGCSVAQYCSEGITAGQGEGANELDVKNLSRWPNQDYYNIWVVTEIENNNGGSGIQGYAYFPTTSPVDGTVILYNAFGTEGNLKSYTNMNRTLTHELGHGFALFHTFQGGSCSETNCELQGDRVCDTPPTTLNSSCSNPACGGTQQVENYMDYTGQSCKDMFTEGQKERMRLSIQNSRSNLINSNGCEPVVPLSADAGITAILAPIGSSCNSVIEPVVTLTNLGDNPLSTVTIRYRTEGPWEQYSWTGLLGPDQSTDIILPEFDGGWGANTLEVETQNPNGTNDSNPSNDGMTANYMAVQDANVVTISITLDVLGGQTTWLLRDAGDNTLAEGGPYANFQEGTVETEEICLLDGCYEFVIMDAVGNGLCCFNGDGSYEVVDQDGNVLASGGEFGNQETTEFCFNPGGSPPVADFNANETTICTGQSVTFSNLTSGSADSFDWKFFGGTPFTVTDENPGAITYSNPGSFDVRLAASNSFGENVELKEDYITVLENTIWYADSDGDGHGNPDETISACTQPDGYVSLGDDCDDSNNADWDSCYDCLGVMFGSATLDNCGTCDANPNNDCEQDCAGVWGGSAYFDECGTCDANTTNDCEQDCAGVWGGSAILDNCGVCDDNPENDCEQDCAGIWGGNAYFDECGTCDDIPENDCIPCDNLEILIVETTNPSCFGGNDGSIEIEIIAESGDFELEWNIGADSNLLNGLTAGTYQATVTLGDCTDFVEIVLSDPEPVALDFANIQDDDCEEGGTGALTILPSGGTPPYEVYYLGSQLSQLSFTNLSGGNYTISVIDANGCSSESSIFIETLGCDSLQYTQVEEEFCGNLEIPIENIIQATPVSEAEGYEWEFFIGEDLHTTILTSDNTLDVLAHGELISEEVYQVRVRGINANIPSEFGSSCELSFRLPTIALSETDCAAGEVSLGQSISSDEVGFAEEYEFRFEDSSGSRTYFYSDNEVVELPEFGELIPGNDYLVSVRINHRGVWGGYGPICELMITPPVITTGPETAFCGNLQINLEEGPIELQPIENAIVYQTVLVNELNSVIDTLETELPLITVEDLEKIDKSLEYEARSRALVNGEWTIWGEICSIGFIENLYQLNLLLFPNPVLSGGQLFAKAQGNWENILIEISDISGRPLKSLRTDLSNGEIKTLPIPNKTKGVYLIKVSHGKQTLTKKLVVQ